MEGTEERCENIVRDLRCEVEKSMGHQMMTPKDFDALSEQVLQKTGQRLSPTTLKRLWGYMRDGGKPRHSTLNILAQFVGYASVEAFADERDPERQAMPSSDGSAVPKTRPLAVRFHLLRRWQRVAVSMLLLAAVAFIGCWGYRAATVSNVHYDVVAKFQVGNLAYESWGGGFVAVRGVESSDECIEIPKTAKHDGVTYRVHEITIDAFKACRHLRTAVLPNCRMDVMRGAFSHATSLEKIVCRCATPPNIGNKFWPCQITDVFTQKQLSTVTLLVPKGSLQAYRSSAWGRFAKIEEF